MRRIVLGLMRQRFFQQRLEFMEISLQQITARGAGINEAAQYGRIPEKRVEPRHAALEPVVVTCQFQPVILLCERCSGGKCRC